MSLLWLRYRRFHLSRLERDTFLWAHRRVVNYPREDRMAGNCWASRKMPGPQSYNHKILLTSWRSLEAEFWPVQPLMKIQPSWHLDLSLMKPLSLLCSDRKLTHTILYRYDTYDTILTSIISTSHQFNSLIDYNLGYVLIGERSP